jgi:hypothetical protein
MCKEAGPQWGVFGAGFGAAAGSFATSDSQRPQRRTNAACRSGGPVAFALKDESFGFARQWGNSATGELWPLGIISGCRDSLGIHGRSRLDRAWLQETDGPSPAGSSSRLVRGFQKSCGLSGRRCKLAGIQSRDLKSTSPIRSLQYASTAR